MVVVGLNWFASDVGRLYWLVPVLGLSFAIGAALALGGGDAVLWLVSWLS